MSRVEKTFSANLQAARRRAGLNQTALAEKLGTGQGSVSHWETGRRQPSLEALVALSKHLDTSIDSLLGLAPKPEDELVHVVSQLSATAKRDVLKYARSKSRKPAR